MPSPNLLILYVRDPAVSATFYRALLQREPSFAAPTYAAFALGGGLMLGLWSSRRAAESLTATVPETGSRSELAFAVTDSATVEQLYREWCERGVPIVQEPKDDVFGRTFVALDPDGHRLRVCVADE